MIGQATPNALTFNPPRFPWVLLHQYAPLLTQLQSCRKRESHLLCSEQQDIAVMKGVHRMVKMLVELMVLLGLSNSAVQRPGYDDSPSPEFFNQSWMASIPDSLLLSQITMPGTHNSMALYGGALAECQSWSLGSQLRVGRGASWDARSARGGQPDHPPQCVLPVGALWRRA
ncbi:hypothetical protein UPYG_G00337530 [Umbra pygmaea]|uniref:Uncharacterized protein n=1 Tax=Umbra pygmaea TaxID=75934 RepID=A0ABD0WCM5_UMBPY